MMTREELAAMTDDEILARYRNKHGDPYMSLGAAKEMHHAGFKWWHLTALAKKRAEEERQEAERRIREVKDRNGKDSFLQHAPFSLSGEHDTDCGEWGPNALGRGLPTLPTHVGAL